MASDNELLTAHSNPDVYGEVEEMVGNIQMAILLSKIGEEQGRNIKIHLNLNAGGMSRNGFDMNVPDIRNQVLSLIRLKNIQVVGIMTHFPNADAADIDETRSALAVFKEQADWVIENANLNRRNILLHVANTSTTLRLPEAHLDMVRVGSLIFGEKLEKEAPDALQQLMSVYSKVGQIIFYPKGSSVGYGSNYTLQRDSYLANLPIGKVNGIPRDLIEVLIGGKRYPTVGNMSMNTTMIDITDGWEEIKSGDEVVIFGMDEVGCTVADSLEAHNIHYKAFERDHDRFVEARTEGYPVAFGDLSDLRLADTVNMSRRSEERRVGKECRSRWSPYH